MWGGRDVEGGGEGCGEGGMWREEGKDVEGGMWREEGEVDREKHLKLR